MRIKGLDFLRGIAILLVIFRHGSGNNILYQIGWAGVDLFFVLSGFLVSGLVFNEYIKHKDVNIKKFLIRRGFKIYPPFYFFIIISIALFYFHTGHFYSTEKIINEIFYLQSYREGMCLHTWSLAVEEHFYLGLALFIFLCLKTKLIERKNFIRNFLIIMLFISFSLRFNISYQNIDKAVFSFTETHLRMDGIIIGVLVSYLYYFTDFYKWFLSHNKLFIVFAIVLISPLFVFQGGSFFMNTIGLTSMNLGFGMVLLLSLSEIKSKYKRFFSFFSWTYLTICFIGIHSYSIYLWHLLSDNIIRLFTKNHEDSFIPTLILALILGIAMSYLIEKPFLKIRDSFFKK